MGIMADKIAVMNDAKEIAEAKNWWGFDKDDPLAKRRLMLLIGSCWKARKRGMKYLGDGKYKVLKKEAEV